MPVTVTVCVTVEKTLTNENTHIKKLKFTDLITKLFGMAIGTADSVCTAVQARRFSLPV
jgi:hypothetical protein